MSLDLRTMYVVTAMVCGVLGAIQLAACITRRFEPWTGFWGLSNLLVGLGTLGVALRDSLPDILSVQLANSVTLWGYLLLVISVRAFADRTDRTDRTGRTGRAGPLWPYAAIAGLATAMFVFVWDDPADHLQRIGFMSALAAAFDVAIIRDGIILARRERLTSAWILVGLFCLTAPIFALRTLLALTGAIAGPTLFPGGAGPYPWMAATAAAFVALRGVALLLMAAERSQHLLLALSRQDPLTGAMNRSGLHTSFAGLAMPRDSGRSAAVSVLIIDLDHFKAINDAHGHTAGDDVLRLFVAVAGSELRAPDTLARHGGDEFVVVLPQTGLDAAVTVAERIRQAFAKASSSLPDLRVRPTLSIGVAEGDAGADSLDVMLRRADEALYRSKRLGRDRVSASWPRSRDTGGAEAPLVPGRMA